MGSKTLTFRTRMMGPFQGENQYTMFRARTLVAQPITLPVGVMHFSTPSCSDSLAHRAQIHKPGTNPMTSRTQMSTNHSPSTRKHCSLRRMRINRNHRGNRKHTTEHRTHEWVVTIARKFSFHHDHALDDLTVFLCAAAPLP